MTAHPAARRVASAPPASRDAARWARGVLVVGYVGVVILCWTTPWGPRVFWTMVLPLLPIGIVLMGFHTWRRICPLAFWGELGKNLKRPAVRRSTSWMESWFFLISFGFLVAMLVLRLVVTNGDGRWLGALLVALGAMAALTNRLFSGKTWCNYVCPVGVVERIYTEPNSLPKLAERTTNSQCVKCTACKK